MRVMTGTVARPRAITILALGDAAIFVFFAAVGRFDHGLPFGTNPVVTVLYVAAPFALSWYALAWLASVYAPDTLARPVAQASRTLLAWLAAGGLGLVLRAMLNGQATIVLIFAQVALLTLGTLLLAWHVAFAWTLRARQHRTG
jgi:hypothetical protein